VMISSGHDNQTMNEDSPPRDKPRCCPHRRLLLGNLCSYTTGGDPGGCWESQTPPASSDSLDFAPRFFADSLALYARKRANFSTPAGGIASSSSSPTLSFVHQLLLEKGSAHGPALPPSDVGVALASFSGARRVRGHHLQIIYQTVAVLEEGGGEGGRDSIPPRAGASASASARAGTLDFVISRPLRWPVRVGHACC
jgi:hypothetical protein